MSNEIYKAKKYFAIALDPIHIGTGGYRIGRVDNTIIREPATGIPKIPGTTIEGNCRNYAFLDAKSNGGLWEESNLACAKGKKVKINGKDKYPCGECKICITFGYAKDNEALQAMASFSDARILFFPVATMIGPVWVTCPMVLKDAGINNFQEPSKDKFITSLEVPDNKLNFGWLLLEKDSSKTPETWNLTGIPKEILNKIVIVPDDLFPQIVNSNLEVRTSVSINPLTGTAEDGALFTYEAIPRGTVFWFEVIYQNPKCFELNRCDMNSIIETVKSGLKYFEFLGVGGMSSRGFGRLKVLNL
jgi:CRISPR-associated protein Cmr4